MQLFYAAYAENDIECTLDTNESGHCVNVLRKKIGDKVLVTNGQGLLYDAEVKVANHKSTVLSLLSLQRKIDRQHPYRLHIAIAPTKNMDRIENFVEKACEFGIDEITPIICERSERKEIKIERMHKIALGAMKQSTSLFYPKINEAIAYSKFIALHDRFYLCTCIGDRVALNKTESLDSNSVFMIGPEGDFSPSEIALASKSKFCTLIDLGNKRLRTETAGIYIASYLYSKNA